VRRCILYIIIAAAVLTIPVDRADVADLHPVQTVALYVTAEGCRIETDTGDLGRGKTVDDAYRDLLRSTPGVIYLDTADFLLVSENAQNQIPEIGKYLKKGVRCCVVAGKCNLMEVSKFLSVHDDLPHISRWKTGDELPVLDCGAEQIKIM